MPGVPDLPLYKKREELRTIFDNRWCDLGPGWSSLESGRDVPEALSSLKDVRHPFIELLLLELDHQSLEAVKARLGHNSDTQKTTAILNKLWVNAGKPRLKETETHDLSQCSYEPTVAVNPTELLRQCRAFFSQEELARFCRSRSVRDQSNKFG